MKLLFLGPPGVGKGTQAAFVTERYGVPQVSTGDMLRAAVGKGTPLGRLAKSHMDCGGLVPDDLIIDLVRSRIAEPDCGAGFLLDGFPRTLTQAQALTAAGVEVDFVIEFWLGEVALLQRSSGRLVHLPSGRTYHMVFNPPRVSGRDDVTGEPLAQRADDRIDTARKRLELYRLHADALSGYYRARAGGADAHASCYARISATGDRHQVRDALFAVLDARVLSVLDPRLAVASTDDGGVQR